MYTGFKYRWKEFRMTLKKMMGELLLRSINIDLDTSIKRQVSCLDMQIIRGKTVGKKIN